MQGMSGKTDGETKTAVDNRFITGSSAVYQRFIRGTGSALCSWLLTSVPSPIFLCKPFSCKAYPGIYSAVWKMIDSQTRTYSERVGSKRMAERRSGVGQCWTPTEQYAQGQASVVSPKASKNRRQNVPTEVRTSEILSKSTYRVQNPDMQRAGRVKAHDVAARRGRAEQCAQETIVRRTLQGIVDTSPERLFRRTNKRSSM